MKINLKGFWKTIVSIFKNSLPTVLEQVVNSDKSKQINLNDYYFIRDIKDRGAITNVDVTKMIEYYPGFLDVLAEANKTTPSNIILGRYPLDGNLITNMQLWIDKMSEADRSMYKREWDQGERMMWQP